MKKLKLKILPIKSKNPESLRIHKELTQACDNFNAYVMDFFETLEILEEKKKKGGADIQETEKNIEFVKSKIEEITSSIIELNNFTPGLTELIEK